VPDIAIPPFFLGLRPAGGRSILPPGVCPNLPPRPRAPHEYIA
jgi:hypothetical protein